MFSIHNTYPGLNLTDRSFNTSVHSVRRWFSSSSTLAFTVSVALCAPKLTHPLIWSVDWMIVQSGQFAIVDPHDPTSILYLTKKEYLSMCKVADSNEQVIVVLAHPEDRRPKDESITAPKPENSPPQLLVGQAVFWKGMRSRLERSYRSLLSPSRNTFIPLKLQSHFDGLVKRWSMTLGHWVGLPKHTQGWLKDMKNVLTHLHKVLKEQSTHGLVLRLKHSHLLTSQYLAATPKLSHAYGHPVRVAHGLPKWLPVNARAAIRARHLPTIRFWLSLLYLYKVMEMPYKIDKALTSILHAPSGSMNLGSEATSRLLVKYREFLRDVYVPSLGGPWDIPKDKQGLFFTPISSGPNGAPAINKIEEDAAALTADRLAGGPVLGNIINVAMSHEVPLEIYDVTDLGKEFLLREPKARPLHSKVHILAEPVGKLRPVAIVDIFTQRVMRPLHDSLFSILGTITQDGTKNQSSLFQWLKEKAIGDWKGFYWSSLDISAATDNISRSLYRVLLEELYAKSVKSKAHSIREYANDVMELMCNRDFTVSYDIHLKKTIPPLQFAIQPSTVRYSSGQPMGILGSFGLLGLWNHSWVQFASYLVCGKLISSYGVTGDDVVIAERQDDTPIGRMYVNICEQMGIPISLSKSFVSCRLFNFLSRTVLTEGEISPISIKEDFSIRDSSGRVGRALKTLRRQWWESTGNGWLSKAVKQFLYPSEYLAFLSDKKTGALNGYGLRAILAFLSPGREKASLLGISNVPVFGWLSAFAGSTVLLAHGEYVHDNTLSKVAGYQSQYGLLSSMAELLLEEVIDIYNHNEVAGSAYTLFREAQNRAIQTPGVGSLFLPTEWDYYEYHSNDTRWLYPEINSGYTNQELSNRLGEAWWSEENIQQSLMKIIDWLLEIPKCRDYSNADLFEHQSRLSHKNKFFGEDLMSAQERRVLSLVYRAMVLYPGKINISISTKLTDYLEQKYLGTFTGMLANELE